MGINPLSRCSFYTEIFFNNTLLSTATSFAYKYNGNKYLITNYHVAYGRNPETEEVIHKNCALPNKLKIHYYDDKLKKQEFDINYPEYTDNPKIDKNNPFKTIRIKDVLIDIGVCKLNSQFKGICINEVNEKYQSHEHNTNVALEVTEALYVLGYPCGINIDYTPIWKKSSIASEPEMQPNGIPYFYIDTTTREGMSGSPVIFFTASGTYKLKNGNQMLLNHGYIYNFVGIYSGRDRNDKPHIAQLGKVWNKSLIEKIIIKNF